MKSLFKSIGILIIVLCLNSCKENTKKAELQKSAETSSTIQNEEKAVNYTPPSDKLFTKAIKDFDDNYLEGAETLLNEAILAIEYEGAGLDGIPKNAFENAINDLKALNKKIKDGKHVTKHQLLQAIANVRYPLYHPTFQVETAIVIAKPEEQNDLMLNQALDEINKFFKSENKEFDDAIKKDMETLKKEGEQIEKLKAELQSKMKNHLKKTQEFYKDNNPEYYDERYILMDNN